MIRLHRAEENYLKAIYHLSQQEGTISTRKIAQELDSKDSSVTDMLKRLAVKELINYKKYHGVTLTPLGAREALRVIRRHRLWEVFLVDKLNFKWDEVHDLAEQLEHIQSKLLIDRLESFLGNPSLDPHGDPIPDVDGNIIQRPQIVLSKAETGKCLQIIRVKDDSSSFLQYLDNKGIGIGDQVEILEKISFDDSMDLKIRDGKELHVSRKVADLILVSELN